MKIDRKSIVAKLKADESDRQRISIYASKSVYEEFAEKCKADGATPSKVVEYLMREFNASESNIHTSGKKKKS